MLIPKTHDPFIRIVHVVKSQLVASVSTDAVVSVNSTIKLDPGLSTFFKAHCRLTRGCQFSPGGGQTSVHRGGHRELDRSADRAAAVSAIGQGQGAAGRSAEEPAGTL